MPLCLHSLLLSLSSLFYLLLLWYARFVFLFWCGLSGFSNLPVDNCGYILIVPCPLCTYHKLSLFVCFNWCPQVSPVLAHCTWYCSCEIFSPWLSFYDCSINFSLYWYSLPDSTPSLYIHEEIDPFRMALIPFAVYWILFLPISYTGTSVYPVIMI